MARKKQQAKSGKSAGTAKGRSSRSAPQGQGAGTQSGADDQPAKGATAETATGQQPLLGAQLNVLAQYIKDLSFESPNAPKSLHGPGNNPQLQVNVRVDAEKQDGDTYEVSLNIEANAHSDIGVIYNIELIYAALFRLSNIPENYLHPVLFVDCPTILFPFARRIIADLTHDGSFPPLLLDPIDFGALYQQNAQKAQVQTAGGGG